MKAHIPFSQAAYREGTSTTEQVFVIKLIIRNVNIRTLISAHGRVQNLRRSQPSEIS